MDGDSQPSGLKNTDFRDKFSNILASGNKFGAKTSADGRKRHLSIDESGGGAINRLTEEEVRQKKEQDEEKKRQRAQRKAIYKQRQEKQESILQYRDRAEERRKGVNQDYDEQEEEQLLAALNASANAVPGADPAIGRSSTNHVASGEHLKTLIQESKFLGGDLQHTHLVKGLDFMLLSKVRNEMDREDEEDDLAVSEKEKKSKAKVASERAAVQAAESEKKSETKLSAAGQNLMRSVHVFDAYSTLRQNISSLIRREKRRKAHAVKKSEDVSDIESDSDTEKEASLSSTRSSYARYIPKTVDMMIPGRTAYVYSIPHSREKKTAASSSGPVSAAPLQPAPVPSSVFGNRPAIAFSFNLSASKANKEKEVDQEKVAVQTVETVEMEDKEVAKEQPSSTPSASSILDDIPTVMVRPKEDIAAASASKLDERVFARLSDDLSFQLSHVMSYLKRGQKPPKSKKSKDKNQPQELQQSSKKESSAHAAAASASAPTPAPVSTPVLASPVQVKLPPPPPPEDDDIFADAGRDYDIPLPAPKPKASTSAAPKPKREYQEISTEREEGEEPLQEPEEEEDEEEELEEADKKSSKKVGFRDRSSMLDQFADGYDIDMQGYSIELDVEEADSDEEVDFAELKRRASQYAAIGGDQKGKGKDGHPQHGRGGASSKQKLENELKKINKLMEKEGKGFDDGSKKRKVQ